MRNIEQIQIFYEQFEKLIETKNRSSKTLITYKYVLNKLQNWETIDELLKQINFILNNSNLSQNTLFGQRAIFKVFCEWFSKRNQIYIPFTERINKYKIERGTRRAYTKEELDILFKELKNYNNYKFEVIFKILLTTGIRVSEWDFIDWKELRANNFQIMIKTAKNNNPRPFKIIESNNIEFLNIKNSIIKGLKLNWSSKTIKNQFHLFNKWFIERNPNFKAKISAHILRHTFVTLASESSGVEEIAKVIGHVNSNVTASTYITYNPILSNRKLSKMQDTISSFLNDNGNVSLKEFNWIEEFQKLKVENEFLKQKLSKNTIKLNEIIDFD
ncbi:tyrosine-type recombinase/integrase [Mycoplasma sp. 332]|uniref:tyrosine-type recombinase/integrase n=1 Tax=Mycoplasma sp. 332 TaxID=3458236 RepID=UPI00403725A4